MKRFMSSAASTAASSSSGRAEPPATVSSSSSSAEQPATSLGSAGQPPTPCQLKIVSIRDVQRWLAKEPIASCSSADVRRIREVVALTRKEDVKPLLKKWEVPQQRGKAWEQYLHEFQGKVIKAAQKLQLELSDSAEQPAASGIEQAASMDTADGVDLDEDPVLAELRARQRKRAQASAAEEQRPLAKPKAAKRQNKRTAGTTSDSVEQPVSKRQDRFLTPELFAVCARDPSDPGAASLDSAVQPSPVQQQRQSMHQLLKELRRLSSCAWVVDDADVRLQAMISEATNLQNIPATQKVLRNRSFSALYTGICGALKPTHEQEQDYTHVSLTACYKLEDRALQFVQARDEIEEASMDRYPCLWELKNRQHDAVLNSLPDMPRSPHELVQALKETGASAGTPFGRLPIGTQVKPPFLKDPFYFVRMLTCLELPNLRFADLPIPRQHTE